MVLRLCDCPNCGNAGDYRAPKSRDDLGSFYWFCLDHVRAYNESWDFFGGLTPEEIETRIREATVWERPTWPMGDAKNVREAMDNIDGDARPKSAEHASPRGGNSSHKAGDSPFAASEHEALAVLDLEPPVDFPTLKARYRKLVKKFHPDINNGSHEAEETFKDINQAFTFLRTLYGEETEETS